MSASATTTQAPEAAAQAGAAVAAGPGPIDPARLKLAVTASCDIDRLAEQAAMLAAEVYGYEGDGRALVVHVLCERIQTLIGCVCTLINEPEQPREELEKVVLSSHPAAERVAA